MKAQVIIQGFVQGVGYRFFAVRQAQDYNIRGYVRNLPNGYVEVVAEGEKGILNDFIEQLRIGPVSSQVTGIDIKWFEEEQGFNDFRVRF
jgi:acylphosphatase